jgi:hypothetical protein
MPEREASQRMPLDDLIGRVRDEDFNSRFRRRLTLRETSPHVNPVMLAAAGNNSHYVEAWKEHARRCPTCSRLFEYFGFEL